MQNHQLILNATHKLLWDFNIKTDHLIPARRPALIIINKKKKKKKICKIVDFAVLDDNRINLKESEKKDKYLDLARELKKLWNMKVTIVPNVIGALGTITKGLLKGPEDLEIGGRTENFFVPADHREKIKKNKQKVEQILEPCWRTKKQWDILLMVVTIVIRAPGTVSKILEKIVEEFKISERIKTIQTTALLRSVRILWGVLEIERNLLSPVKTRKV